MISRNETTTPVEGEFLNVAEPVGESLSIEEKESKFRRHLALGRAAVADMMGISLHEWKTLDQAEEERRQAEWEAEYGIERRENLSVAQKLGRAAMAPLRWDRKMIKAIGTGIKKVETAVTLAAWKTVGLMTGKSLEEKQLDYEKRQVKYARKDGDSRFMRGWKHFQRNREKYMFRSAIAGALGYTALRFAPGAVDWYHHQKAVGHHGNAMDAAAANHGEIKAGTTKLSMVVAGGRGEGGMNGQPGAPIDQMMQYGDQNDVNVQAVQYPAEIAPLDQMSMKDSTNIGVADMMSKAQADMASGKPVELIGFSEGTSVALETAQQIAAHNGGVLPSNVHLTLIGSPYTPNSGIAASPFAKGMIGGVVDAMGIPLNQGPLPPGTNVVYYDTDFWANSGNQVPTSMMRQLFEIGMGGHAIPDPNDPHYSFTDGQGVIHTVYSHRNDPMLQQFMDSTGLQIADTASANEAINKLFPLDGSKPDVAGAKAALVSTLEHQGDPGSQFVAQFIQNLPPQYTQLGQDGMDSINQMAEGAAKIQSGDVMGGWSEIMSGMNSFSHILPDAQGALNASGINLNGNNGQSLQMLANNTAGVLKQQTGMDFSSQIHDYLFNGKAPIVNGQTVSMGGNQMPAANAPTPNMLPVPNGNGNIAPVIPSIPAVNGNTIPLPINPTGIVPHSISNSPVLKPTPHIDTPPPISIPKPNIPTPPAVHNIPPAVHTPAPVIHDTPPPVRTIPRPVINTPPAHVPAPTMTIPRPAAVPVPRISIPTVPQGITPHLPNFNLFGRN